MLKEVAARSLEDEVSEHSGDPFVLGGDRVQNTSVKGRPLCDVCGIEIEDLIHLGTRSCRKEIRLEVGANLRFRSEKAIGTEKNK